MHGTNMSSALPRTPMNPTLRLLVCRTDAIGDNTLSLTVANDLKTALPGSTISWMTRPGVAALVKLDRHVDEVIEWDGCTDPRPLLPKLQQRRFDAALVLHPKPKHWLSLAPLLRSAGIPVRVGTGRRWWGALYCTHRVWATRHRDGMHECARAREHGRVLLRALGADTAACARPSRTGLSVTPAALVERIRGAG
jgi:ADP-heptose:LPS heptosyltransferase